MPKAKYAHRGKPKPKSVKAKKVVNAERQEKRAGKRQKAGLAGAAVEYVARTKAIKRLQVTIRDFRRLCILKGIYPRDPPTKKHIDGKQTYYHHKDIAYLMHEPILKKFREFKTFMKKFSRAIGRKEVGEARQLYDNRPTYTLDHIVKARYPHFTDALADLDDALSMVHMFAAFPAEQPIKPEQTATSKRLVREWQYYVARTHSLRKVFFSIKGVYLQAEVRGIPVTWLLPWQFSQALPSDVDYRVMLTFLELHEVVLKFSMFKLYSDLGLAYPPNIRADQDEAGGHLTALEVRKAGEAAAAAGSSNVASSSSSSSAAAITNSAASAEAAAKVASLKSKLKSIVSAAGATGEEGGAGAGAASSSSAMLAAKGAASFSAAGVVSASIYDFVDADDGADNAENGADGGSGDADDDAQMRDMAEFADSEEAKQTIEKARKLRQFQRLFSGLVFFLNREVPRELFELLICSFKGRVGWDGPGSPYGVDDNRITHHVVDRPMAGTTVVEGREYVQPQWLADSINARMLLPISKYAPGAVLPPHLSPFVDDNAEGYIPAYRQELDRLRAAASVTGRLADVLAEGQAALAASGHKVVSRAGADADAAEEDGDSSDDEEAVAADDDDEEEEDDEQDDDGVDLDEDEDDDDAEEEEEDEEDDDAGAMLKSAESEAKAGGAGRAAKKAKTEAGASSAAGGVGLKAGVKLSAVEAERRTMAASLLTSKQRKAYKQAADKQEKAVSKVVGLEEKRKAAAAKGDVGLGGSGATAAAAPAGKAAAKGGKQQPAPGSKRPRS